MAITVVVLNTTTEPEGDTSVDIIMRTIYSIFIIVNRFNLLDTTEVNRSVVVSSDTIIIVVTSVGLTPSPPPSSSSPAPYQVSNEHTTIRYFWDVWCVRMVILHIASTLELIIISVDIIHHAD